MQFLCLMLGATNEQKWRLRYSAAAEQVSEAAPNFLNVNLVIYNLKEAL